MIESLYPCAKCAYLGVAELKEWGGASCEADSSGKASGRGGTVSGGRREEVCCEVVRLVVEDAADEVAREEDEAELCDEFDSGS